jgi:hypothetical protein
MRNLCDFWLANSRRYKVVYFGKNWLYNERVYIQNLSRCCTLQFSSLTTSCAIVTVAGPSRALRNLFYTTSQDVPRSKHCPFRHKRHEYTVYAGYRVF